jgi:hypothetical protein
VVAVSFDGKLGCVFLCQYCVKLRQYCVFLRQYCVKLNG